MSKRGLESILVPLSFMLFTLWFMYDACSVGIEPENLVMVLPVGLFVCAVLAVVIGFEVRKCLNESKDLKPADNVYFTRDVKRSLTGMLMFVIYVASMDFIGYDVAALIFMPALLLYFGERNYLKLFVYSIGFTVFVVTFFWYMLPYPVPCLFTKLFLAD